MYTQCPQCEAVYRVTSTQLSSAGGEVQCGACGARFDALDRLSDVYPSRPESGATEETPAPELEEVGEEVAEEEQPEEIVEAPEAGELEGDGEAETVELADLEPGPEEVEEKESEGETARAADSPAEEPAGEAPAEDQAEPSAETTAEQGETDETRWQLTEPFTEEESAPEDADRPAEEISAEGDRVEEAAALLKGIDEESPVNLDVAAGELFAASELADQEMPDLEQLELVEGLPPDEAPQPTAAIEAPPADIFGKPPSRAWRWIRRLLLTLIILALIAAGIHSQRGILMRNSQIAPLLERLYGRFGITVQPTWDISEYRIIDSSAEIEPEGDLRVTLSFVNEAAYAQPYPVLRVSLEDRWGDEIGSRQLPPGDYVSDYVTGRMLGPGRRIQGRATVEGPDLEAVGFRLDLCLPDAGGALACLSSQP